MADQNSIQSNNTTQTTQSFLGSPNPRWFLSKSISDSAVISPTSILDSTRNCTSPQYDQIIFKQNTRTKVEQEATGLALIDSIDHEEEEGDHETTFYRSAAVNRSMVLFGAKLKVHIPTTDSPPASESPVSPADFGIKTRPFSPFSFSATTQPVSRQLSLKEMEMSEDYTCVITHGPNPKTTHIFDDCIVDSCCYSESDECLHHFSHNNTFSENSQSPPPHPPSTHSFNICLQNGSSFPP